MKECRACKQSLPLDNFSKCCSRPDGLAWRCRACDKAAGERYRGKVAKELAREKLCGNCSITKPQSEFHRNKLSKDLLSAFCRECARARASAWRKANHERKKAANREWYWRDPEARRAVSLAYHREHRLEQLQKLKKRYRENRDVLLAAGRKYVLANKEKVRARQLDWKHRNRAKVTASNSRRKASIYTTGSVAPHEWEEILETFDHRCAYCLTKLGNPTMDHFRPLSRGGTHSPDNVVPACVTCNSTKHNGLMSRWVRKLVG